MPSPARRGLARLLAVVVATGLLTSLAAPALAASDVTPPTLQSLSRLTPSTATAGDTVTLAWQASDDVAVMQVQVNLRDAAGKDHIVYANAPASSGSTTVDGSWANGPVVVTWVWVYDVNGNFAVYYRDGTLAVSGSGYSSSHTVSLSAADFSTQGISADVTAPSLAGIALTAPGPFTRDDTVSIDVDARDDAGVRFLNVVLVDEASKVHSLQASGDPDRITRVVDDTWADGPVSLLQVEVEDMSFNKALYRSDGSVTYSAGVTGPATHSLDFGAVGFSTHDVGGDVTPPTLASVTLQTSGPLVEGDEVRFTVDAADSSGVSQVALALVDAANKGHTLFAMSGDSTLSATIDTSWAIGEVRIGGVRVYDTKQNEAHYNPSGALRTVPPGATSHGVDLTSQVFWVEGRPTLAVTSAPPSTSTSSTADFGFATADRDTAPQDLGAACTIDGATRACTPSGATFSSLSTGDHRLDVRVFDPQGHASTASYTWRITPAPTVTARAFPSTATLASTVPLRYSGSGAASYDVRYRTATATSGFTAWAYPSGWQRTTATQLTSPSLTPGRTFCFAVRARSAGGSTSAWSTSRCTARAYDDAVLRPSALWSRVSSSLLFGGSALRTTARGASVTTGTVAVRRIALVATTCPTCGAVSVYLGGQLVAQRSLVSSTVRHRVVLTVPLLSLRSGAVMVRTTSSGKKVQLDGIVLSRL